MMQTFRMPSALWLAVRDQAPIRETRPFDALALPAFDTAAIEQLLMRDLPGLRFSCGYNVCRNTCLACHAGSEAWVADGMRRVPPNGRECPFCAQDMSNSAVLAHYRAFFSDDYASLKTNIARLAQTIDQLHSDNGPVAFERARAPRVSAGHSGHGLPIYRKSRSTRRHSPMNGSKLAGSSRMPWRRRSQPR